MLHGMGKVNRKKEREYVRACVSPLGDGDDVEGAASPSFRRGASR